MVGPIETDVGISLHDFAKASERMFNQFEQALSATQSHDAHSSTSSRRAGQRAFLQEAGELWRSIFLASLGIEERSCMEDRKGDGRFRDETWTKSPYFSSLKRAYVASARSLHEFVEQSGIDERTRMQLRFYARLYTDAISPSNFAVTNPEVIREAIRSRGESLSNGLKNLIDDIQKGRITTTDETAFELGVNLAITPGFVVFENELMQLIQYVPTTEVVGTTPVLIVPPCINKFYVFDLAADNSFVRYLVEQGHSVFLISWRNPDEALGHLTWDDYIELGVLQAVDVVTDVAGTPRVHALGFCVGGTILGCAAAVLATKEKEKLASLTLLATMLDFKDPGELGIIIDEPYILAREATIGKGGLLPGKELGFVFSMLRANDLIWSYVVNNYLKGASPDAFDLLYWNSDAVNLPGPMYCWYIRNTYLENNIKSPARTVQCGAGVDLSRISLPTYLLAAREDHIVPWRTAYATTGLVRGESRFVLASSGHVAGVINAPSRTKRSYWINERRVPTADEWLSSAQENPGSWWPDWSRWLKSQSAAIKPAPIELGNARYRPIEPAPGRYVRAKVE
jgi:polyhydroxyalkanoate synthase subunit PhaC